MDKVMLTQNCIDTCNFILSQKMKENGQNVQCMDQMASFHVWITSYGHKIQCMIDAIQCMDNYMTDTNDDSKLHIDTKIVK